MENIEEISKHYIEKLAEMDKEKNDVYVRNKEHRTIYFWLADDLGKSLGLSPFDVDNIIQFLSKHGLVYWRSIHTRTLELTDKGYNWKLHMSLFEKPIPKTSVIIKNNPWISGLFYLTILITLLITLAVISSIIKWYALPIVFISGILMTGVIGAFQLLNDDKIEERSFLKLMSETYKRLTLLRKEN